MQQNIFEIKTCRCQDAWEQEPGQCDKCGKTMPEFVGKRRQDADMGLRLLDKAVTLTQKKIKKDAKDRGMTLEQYIKYNRLPLED